MALLFVVLVFALSSMLAPHHTVGFPASENLGFAQETMEDALGAQRENRIQERSPSYPQPEVQYSDTGAYGLKINPWVVVHACWKPYPTAGNIYQAIVNALVTSGIAIPDMKEALSVRLAVVAVKERAKLRYAGYETRDTLGTTSYHSVQEAAGSAILQSSSLSHLAWLWTDAVWTGVRPRVQDVLCLSVVLELLLADEKRPLLQPPAEAYATAGRPVRKRQTAGSRSSSTRKKRPLYVGTDIVAMAPTGRVVSGSEPMGNQARYSDGLFEGDITGGIGLEVDQTTGRLKYVKPKPGSANIGLDAFTETGDFTLWPDATLYFEFHSSVSLEDQKLVINSLQDIVSSTCVKLALRNGVESIKNYVIIRNDLKGCASDVGMRVAGPQELELGRGCMIKGTIIHEILHALGFHHEQSRADRDEFVEIRFENIKDPSKHSFNFDKMEGLNFATPYDIMSIMHYELNAFANEGTLTIVPKPGKFPNVDPKLVGFVQSMGLEDINMINRVYGCGAKINFFANADDDVRWNFQCDWGSNNARGVRSLSTECSTRCKEQQTCTHYTWTNEENGTCWLKVSCPSSPFTRRQTINGVASMCGYLSDRVKALGCTRSLEG